MTSPPSAPDLVARLIRNWKAWGSPTDRDDCINETCMAMDCKEAAAEIERLTLGWEKTARDQQQEIERLRAALMDAWRITNAILNKDQYLEAVHNILSRALFPHIYERDAGEKT